MKAPARDPGDFCIAQCAESTLLMPEIAKSVGTPKRCEDDGSVARGVAGAFPGVCGEFGAVKLTIQLCLAEQQRGQ